MQDFPPFTAFAQTFLLNPRVLWGFAFSCCLCVGLVAQAEEGPNTSRQLAVYSGHTMCVNDVSCAPNGKLIASCGDDASVRVLEFPTLTEWRKFESGAAPFNCVSVGSTSNTVEAGSGRSQTPNANMKFWVIDESREVTLELDRRPGILAFDHRFGGGWRAYVDLTGVAFVTDGGLKMALVGHERDTPCWDAAFFEEEPFLVTGGGDGMIVVWGLGEFARPAGAMKGHEGGVLSVAPGYGNMPYLATAGSDGKGKVWTNWNSEGKWELVCELVGHTGPVGSIVYSPNGKLLATASADKTVRLWNATDGKLLHTFEGHTDRVTTVDFHPLGRHLVSGGADRTVRVWQIGTDLIPEFKGDWSQVALKAEEQMEAGNYEESVKLFSEAIDVAKTQLGRLALEVGILSVKQSLAKVKLNETDDIDSVLKRSKTILYQLNPEPHVEVARLNLVKARQYLNRGTLQDAMQLLRGGVENQLRMGNSTDPLLRAQVPYLRGVLHQKMAISKSGDVAAQEFASSLSSSFALFQNDIGLFTEEWRISAHITRTGNTQKIEIKYLAM